MEPRRISGGTDRRPFKALPSDAQRVTPYLVIKEAAKALDFYKEAFGAEEVEREELPDGKLLHGSIRLGNSLVMMSDEFPGSDAHNPGDLGTSTVVLHIYSDDVDALWERPSRREESRSSLWRTSFGVSGTGNWWTPSVTSGPCRRLWR
ncbi:MAG: VOC family protein [Thermoplasmata archaeon]